MDNKLSSEKTEVLTRIWQGVLGREHIGPEDNFFTLGGDPWKAIELFHDIERTFGRRFPPVVIYQAATITSLVVLLEAPSSPPIPKCVRLRAGGLKPLVFLTHGLGGNILEFFEVVRHLETRHPIYGLQARGIDGLEKPCSKIEKMAHFHIDAIRALQGKGPYILIGYSLGGLVAFEMARFLAESGDDIALLVMIDSYPSLRYATLRQSLGVYGRKVRHHTSRMIRLPLHGAMSYARRRSRDDSYAPKNHAGDRKADKSLGIAFTPAMHRVREAAAQALKDYQPRYYPGRIRFVRAASPLHFPDDPEKVWAKFTEQFEVETVPGDHHELLTTQAESLAAVISRYLREVSVKRVAGSPH